MASLKTLLALLPLAIPSLASSLNSEYTFNPLHHLAGIAPYFEPLDPPRSPDAPQGCTVTRAAYLSRHAAIYANDFDYEEYMGPSSPSGRINPPWIGPGSPHSVS
ncbi:hypothetical protein MCOR02_004184 [Pyricularia oryzae]|nr:hypothetical protein MCOR02_004184 [Pyricularia oryzae]